MDAPTLDALLKAINYSGIVSGYTHDLYRYPARFSPLFARSAIELFTDPGDCVLDPFAGSFTTIVECLAAGRHAVGTDISPLAVFLGGVKTMICNDRERNAVLDWAINVAPDLSPRLPVRRHWEWKEAGYQQNLPWRFRKVAEQAINATDCLPDRLRPVARCIVLKTVQWAVDCKKYLPTAEDFRARLIDDAASVIQGLAALGKQVESLDREPPTIELLRGPADKITTLPSQLLKNSPARLVITSPPYPGVHVLYHRWQVLGRKETPAPFWIADCYDGQGSSYYTFGDRRNERHEELYFAKLLAAFAEIRKVIRDDAVVVQLVGFGNPETQLPLYICTMKKAGFVEYEKEGHRRSQYWRSVPNRKWYTWLKDEMKRTSEILLIHRAS
jgi:hypothetical protein